ncbi:hypothetical protein DY000_02021357 [Brassica cretica]|uniref:Arabidopsis retrotransposon Orf1 C-terminal domain-containing protein n=1 Tax=Brassica cretica TaxID=69181 RepID=A0ABQ7ENI2_BRACR|nr:hypothetical protein DY000_02021357 [Brassica cretica]
MASRIKPPHARGEPEDDTISPTYPWPREEGTEISLTDPYILASLEERWDKEASRCYKSFLKINILPTRFVDTGDLNDLGLHEDLHAVLQVLGIADLCHLTHPLYPYLVRQVLATVELTFKRPGFPIFEEASFTFYASGVKHSKSLEKLTEIYEISEEYTKTSFLRKFPPEQAFWKFTASGDFKSRSASQSLIRNPVLRIAAKMLFAGVEDEIKSAYIGIPTSEMKTSPGCVLVQMFVDKKSKVIKGSLKKDRSGILLTPLFRYLELDLSPYQCNETTQFIYAPYLINCQILRDEMTYSFMDDTMDEPEFVGTVGSDTAYDIGPLDDDADDATYHRWMVDSQRKNSGLMKKILKAITITGGCLGTPSTAELPQGW